MGRWASLAALAVLPLSMGTAGTAHSQAATRYPYTLVDLGTFGGPSSFLDLPGVPITGNGTVLGAADTTAPDTDWPHCGFCYDRYIQHALAWRDGRRTDLGALPGNNSSQIYELNGHGVGAGGSENGRTDPHTGLPAAVAVLFKHGKVINLGTLPGGAESFALDITSQGQVAGNSSNATSDPFPNPIVSPFGWRTETRGFVWRNGAMRDLGTLGGADTLEYAQNDRGQITGVSYTNSTVNPATGIPTAAPYLWQHGHMTDLGTLGGHLGFPNWINNKGEVTGQSDLAGDQTAQPFLWKDSHMIKLPTIGGGYGFGFWINQRGDVTGGYLAPPHQKNFHGFIWHNGHMTDLPPVGGAPWAFGNAINNRDQVVGNENTASNHEIIAVLWSGGHGYDLNTLIAPNALQMISADYITNQGDIFGHGVLPNGDQRVFLLIRNPGVPLPPTSTPARPLPSLTGPPDHRISVHLALRAAGRGPSEATFGDTTAVTRPDGP